MHSPNRFFTSAETGGTCRSQTNNDAYKGHLAAHVAKKYRIVNVCQDPGQCKQIVNYCWRTWRGPRVACLAELRVAEKHKHTTESRGTSGCTDSRVELPRQQVKEAENLEEVKSAYSLRIDHVL